MRDLTVRGRCFLAAGVAAVICGIQIGERDFVRIGLLAAALPLLARLLFGRRPREIWVRRNVSAVQVEAGDVAQVVVEVTNGSEHRTGTLQLEEDLPRGLGQRQRFWLSPLRPHERLTLHYPIQTQGRGRFPVGPMNVRSGDVLGMVELQRVAGVDRLPAGHPSHRATAPDRADRTLGGSR